MVTTAHSKPRQWFAISIIKLFSLSAAGQMHCLCLYSGTGFWFWKCGLIYLSKYTKASYSKRHAHSSTYHYLLSCAFKDCLCSVRTGEIVAYSQSFCESRINCPTSQVAGCQVALTGKNCTYCIVLGSMGSSQVGLKKPHRSCSLWRPLWY